MQTEEYLTGERLQSIADVVITDPGMLHFAPRSPTYAKSMIILAPDINSAPLQFDVETFRQAQFIFLYPEMLSRFRRWVWPYVSKRIVLLLHNSDMSVGMNVRDLLEDMKVAHIFSQNIDLEHPRLGALPIGLANSQWPHGDLTVFHRVVQETQERDSERPQKKLLYCNFKVQTNAAVRAPLQALLLSRGFATYSPPTLAYEHYLRELAAHHYAVSPIGNGRDCHRTWECLYLGVTPLVDAVSPNIVFGRELPLRLISDWQQLTAADLLTDVQTRRASAVTHPLLTLSYWEARVYQSLHEKSPLKDLLDVPHVFASGSCRLLVGLGVHGAALGLHPIHAMTQNHRGPNFLGKLHNIKQHIQLVRWLKGDVLLPAPVLELFLTSYSPFFQNTCDRTPTCRQKVTTIRREWGRCAAFLFEICSLKIYRQHASGLESQCELYGQPQVLYQQTSEELRADLEVLLTLLPLDRPVVFQCHFRPHIMNVQDEHESVPQREMIYQTLCDFAKAHPERVILYDPSEWIGQCPGSLMGTDHFTDQGHHENAQHLLRLLQHTWEQSKTDIPK